MAEANISIGTVGFTGFLLINARKVSDPLTVFASQSLPLPLVSSNIVFTGLDPETYYFDFRNSPDGVALGTLISTYEVKVTEEAGAAFSMEFYTVDGVGAHDPVSTPEPQTDLVDPTLDGKNISMVMREGFRPLKPGIEYELIAGGGIRLLGGLQFAHDEVITIGISEVTAPPSGSSGFFTGFVTLTANTPLDSTHYNKLLDCDAPGSQMVHTLPAVSTVPDKTFFYFIDYSGNQLQTKIITTGPDIIVGYGAEITFGKQEKLWINKRGGLYKMVDPPAGLSHVGEIVKPGEKDQLNILLEDGALHDGDDYPRFWNWLKTVLPVDHYIIDNAVTGAYVWPVGKEGLFVLHSTLKKFRMPNTQGWSERGLKDFNTYGAGTDATRTYNYPGGTQKEKVGPHNHATANQNKSGSGPTGEYPNFNAAPTAHNVRTHNIGTHEDTGQFSSTDINQDLTSPFAYSTENIVKNIGRLYARRI